MENILSGEEKKLMQETVPPAVTIILPFEPKMSLKHELEHTLKITLGKVEKELFANYPPERAAATVNRLAHIISHLNYDTHKKSLAIFVSPKIEKTFYLDVPVQAKIIIDGCFEIRDLISNKKQNRHYLILHLTAKFAKTYLADNYKIDLIKSNIPSNIHAYERDMPQRVAHFDDPEKHREILTENFLHHMDDGLTMMLAAFPLPVFVIGSEKILGHFKKITKNQSAIIEYVHGSFDDLKDGAIERILEPHVIDWDKVKQVTLLKQIEKAKDDHKLANGINEVLEASTHKNSRLLILEKDFTWPLEIADDGQAKKSRQSEHMEYSHDLVNTIMEKVLEYGGDVEFVDNDLLNDYDHIALIKYY